MSLPVTPCLYGRVPPAQRRHGFSPEGGKGGGAGPSPRARAYGRKGRGVGRRRSGLAEPVPGRAGQPAPAAALYRQQAQLRAGRGRGGRGVAQQAAGPPGLVRGSASARGAGGSGRGGRRGAGRLLPPSPWAEPGRADKMAAALRVGERLRLVAGAPSLGETAVGAERGLARRELGVAGSLLGFRRVGVCRPLPRERCALEGRDGAPRPVR